MPALITDREPWWKIGDRGQKIKSQTYNSWCGMRVRCGNPNSHLFKYYGGRGITVCDRWKGKEGFRYFLEDMGECPPGKSIDRIDNSGNYEPGNCRWATMEEQASNRRPHSPHDPNCLRQKSIRAGMPYHMVYQRVVFHGWSEEDALAIPRNHQRPEGAVQLPKRSREGTKPTGRKTNPDSLRQKALKAGLPYHTVFQRMNSRLWTLEQALTTPVGVSYHDLYRTQTPNRKNAKRVSKPPVVRTAEGEQASVSEVGTGQQIAGEAVLVEGEANPTPPGLT